MQRPPLALALALAQCTGDKDTSSGFDSQHQSGGPSSFDGSTGFFNDTATTASTTGSTADPTTGALASTSTGEPATTTTTASGTTDAPPACGDGTVDPGEFCDDGNGSDGDLCLSDCTAGHAVLTLVGRGDDPAAIATFHPEHGWTVDDATYDVRDADLETTPDGALAVVRRAGAVPDEQDELWFAVWTEPEPALLRSAAVVGDFGFALDTPAIASVPDTVTLAFLGTDNKHYAALQNAGAWGPFGPIPASTLDVQAFGPGGAALATDMTVLYAIYAGDDDRVYVATRPMWSAAWEPSVQAPPPAVVDTIRPAAVVTPEGDLVLAYVRASDHQIGLTRRSTDDNTWDLEALVDPQALTNAPPALLRTDAGGWLLAWQGFNNDGIYLAAGATHDEWDTPVAIEVPPASTPPQLVPGPIGADADLLYTAGGALRHARIAAGEADLPADVPGLTGATSVAATRVLLAP